MVNRDYDIFLVTGATGFLGSLLVSKLLFLEKKVRVLVLKGDPQEKNLSKNVEIVYGDVSKKDSLKEFFKGDLSNACLIHSAGIITIGSKITSKLYNVNVSGTKNIINMAVKHNIKKIIYVSSVHAIKEEKRGQVIKETKIFKKSKVRGAYAKTKAEATHYVLEQAKKGLNVSVVHPSGIIGPHDFQLGNITSTIIRFCNRILKYAVIGGYDFVDCRDVVDGIISCSYNGRPNETYILCNKRYMISDILNILSRMGYGKEPKYLPLWFVKILSPFFELSSILKKRKLFLTPYSAYTLGANSNFSHEKANRELSYAVRPIEKTLYDLVIWLQNQKLIPRIELKKI